MPIRVLLCDDASDMRLLFKVLFELDEDLEIVAEASNGIEAIVMAAHFRPDVVILDVAMPFMDGLTALPELRRLAPASRVIVLSASASRAVSRRARSLGADRYLSKDLDPCAVIQILREVVARPNRRKQEPALAAVATRAVGDAWMEDEVFERSFPTDVGVALVDRKARPLNSNRALQELTGYDAHELRSRPFTELMRAHDAGVDRALHGELFEGRRNNYEVYTRVLRKDGSTVEGRLMVAAVRACDSPPDFAIGLFESLFMP